MRKLIYTILLFFGMFTILNGQSQKERADKAFQDLKYQKAIDYYVSYLKDNKDNEASLNLAEAYYLTGQYFSAENTLEYLYNEKRDNAHVVLKYAKILLLNNKKNKAKEILQDYIKIHPSTPEYKQLFESINIMPESKVDSFNYLISKALFNSDASDFCPSFYNDDIIFTSQKGGKIDPWTGKSYSNIYITVDNLTDSKPLDGNLNGKFHNGAITFFENQLIFTRNNNKKGKNDEYNLILAIAVNENGKWNFKEEFPFNDRNFSNAYPAYIPKDEMLIFSSDKPGGYGGMDFYSTVYENGKWSNPVNLGPKINTSGDEVFCTYNGSDLYFSSDGRPGLGGLDIFKTKFTNGQIGDIIHLNSPINSNRDDFSLITQDDLETAFFSSNREGNGAIDHIYFIEKEKVEVEPQIIVVSGIVLDEFTRIPLKETTVTIENTNTKKKQSYITSDDGRFKFEVLSNESYFIIGEKNNIKTTSQNLSNANTSDQYYYTLLHNDPRFSLEGYAINNKTDKGVEDVNVICFNKSDFKEKSDVSKSNGFFKFQLEQNSDFEISGTKNGYFTSISEATTKGLNRSTTLYVKLYLSIEEVIIGETKIMGKESFAGYSFDPVYYDLDKDNIRQDAAIALDKVVSFMKKNPTLTIELGSHTDSRASDEYNMDLSQRRAKSAVNYIIKNGIAPERITAQGYGEKKLVNGCANGIKCSEENHQLNRRTEIKITGYNQ